jgi:hypothetical protein
MLLGAAHLPVATARVFSLAHPYRVVKDFAGRSGGKPDLEGGVSGYGPVGHAHEVLDGRVINVTWVDPEEDVGQLAGRQFVEPADVIEWPVQADVAPCRELPSLRSISLTVILLTLSFQADFGTASDNLSEYYRQDERPSIEELLYERRHSLQLQSGDA